jgi:hypothetical protein
VSAEVDKVELVFTKFVSLINSTPTIQVCVCACVCMRASVCARLFHVWLARAGCCAGTHAGHRHRAATPARRLADTAPPRLPNHTHAPHGHHQTLLPLTPTGELCDLDGNCVDAAEDEIFKLTTQARGAVCRAPPVRVDAWCACAHASAVCRRRAVAAATQPLLTLRPPLLPPPPPPTHTHNRLTLTGRPVQGGARKGDHRDARAGPLAHL